MQCSCNLFSICINVTSSVPGLRYHLYFNKPQIPSSYSDFPHELQVKIELPIWASCSFPILLLPNRLLPRLLYLYHRNTCSGQKLCNRDYSFPSLTRPHIWHHFWKLSTALHFLVFNPKASHISFPLNLSNASIPSSKIAIVCREAKVIYL